MGLWTEWTGWTGWTNAHWLYLGTTSRLANYHARQKYQNAAQDYLQRG